MGSAWSASAATSFERPSHEKAIGIGPAYYSGEDTRGLVPGTAGHISFSANYLANRRFNIVNRFEFGLLLDGKNFAGSQGAYSGYVGSYTLAPRINFSTTGIQPYVEAGGMIGLFAISLSGVAATSTVSQNQTALKYGYVVGTGFDWMKGGERGAGGGIGIGVSYFRYANSPGKFEFPVGSLNAVGIKIDLRYLVPPATN